MTIHIRRMRSSDIPHGLRLCRAAGWNQIGRDWEILLRHGAEDCLVACREESVVGTTTITRYAGRFHWIGMVLVDPSERRQGIGTSLVNEALRNLEGAGTIRLDATPAGTEVYRRLGFVEESQLVRLAGTAGRVGNGRPLPAGVRCLPASDLARIAAWDEPCFGAPRPGLLEWWRAGAPSYAWIAADGAAIRGYCMGRHGHAYDQIGPVVARDVTTAQALVTAVWTRHPGGRFVLDVPLEHREWLAWLKQSGFTEQRPLVRMYRGANEFGGIRRCQFAMMALEVG